MNKTSVSKMDKPQTKLGSVRVSRVVIKAPPLASYVDYCRLRLYGSWDNWRGGIGTHYADPTFTLYLSAGTYQCKYLLDGHWFCVSPAEASTDAAGNQNDMLVVSEEADDFTVFEISTDNAEFLDIGAQKDSFPRVELRLQTQEMSSFRFDRDMSQIEIQYTEHVPCKETHRDVREMYVKITENTLLVSNEFSCDDYFTYENFVLFADNANVYSALRKMMIKW